MTPSIIRRFAKYHGIDMSAWDKTSGRWDVRRSAAIEMFRRHLEPDMHHAADITAGLERVVQALTRIEDAEFAIAEAAQWDPSGVRHLALTQLANDLFDRANIEPDEWFKVTE